MSALTDRITEVLRLHGDHDTRANADYLAQQIAALFTEEERSYYDHAEPYSTGYEHRWVSTWSAECETEQRLEYIADAQERP